MSKQNPFSKALSFIEAKLQQVDGIRKPQLKFLSTLFEVMWTVPHRINFLNMGRFSSLSEQTFRLQFLKGFDFLGLFISMLSGKGKKEMLLVFDPSFISKSGKHTYGLARYWNGKAQRAEKGLEIGCLGAIDVADGTAYHLLAKQTRPDKTGSRMEQYVAMIKEQTVKLLSISRYLCVDGYFMKSTFIGTLQKEGFKVVTKMRSDGNLREVYKGIKSKGRGRPKVYGNKIDLKQIDKRKWKKCYQTEEMTGYERILYCVALKQQVKVVYVHKPETTGYEVLLSTDMELSGSKIIAYYRLRFQIEFLIRDAKQHGGLEDCQARDEQKLHYHFNMALGSVSTAKLTLWATLRNKQEVPFSMHNIKQYFYNKYLTETIFGNLDLDLNCRKINKLYHQCLDIGRIAA
ncbi:DDE family transposase [Sediminibacterium magnilacihabitans]|nr:DDE family transposase [Sediminibacterium magnilacihabitans]